MPLQFETRCTALPPAIPSSPPASLPAAMTPVLVLMVGVLEWQRRVRHMSLPVTLVFDAVWALMRCGRVRALRYPGLAPRNGHP